MTREYEDFLAHYGVKGQKWGVRNYQNPDGTLIHPKGRKKEKKVPESDTWRKEESKWLSDDELNRRNNRMQREAQYKQNIDNRHPVKKEFKSALKKIFIGTAIGVLTTAMLGNYKGILESGKQFLSANNFEEALHRRVVDLRR